MIAEQRLEDSSQPSGSIGEGSSALSEIRAENTRSVRRCNLRGVWESRVTHDTSGAVIVTDYFFPI
jgi:hypothetical protein